MKHSRYSLPNRFVGACGALLVMLAVFAIAGFVRGQGGDAPTSPAGTPAPLRPLARPGDLPASPPAASNSAESEISAPSIAQVAQQGPTALIERAVAELSRRRSIVAKARHRAELYGRELIGSGEYAQGPSSSRLLRYELRMQVNDRVVNLLQVGDGRHLWTSRQLNDEPTIERIDVDRVLASAGQGRPTDSGDLFASIGIGGLPQLLAALERDFEFQEVFQAQLGPLPVYGISGTWKRTALAEFLPLQEAHIAAGNPADLRQLRPHLPDEVVLFLGADDLFPYRIEFFRTAAARPAEQSKGQGAGAQSDVERPLLVLEFFEVRFDVLLEERLFQFTAGSRPYADVTDAFIQRRGK